jgi:hypothetical protein
MELKLLKVDLTCTRCKGHGRLYNYCPTCNGSGKVPDYKAQAQLTLHQVVDWLNTFEFYDDESGDSDKLFRDRVIVQLRKDASK